MKTTIKKQNIFIESLEYKKQKMKNERDNFKMEVEILKGKLSRLSNIKGELHALEKEVARLNSIKQNLIIENEIHFEKKIRQNENRSSSDLSNNIFIKLLSENKERNEINS